MAPKRFALLVSALIMILASPLPPSASHWFGLSLAAAEESKAPEPFDHRYPDWSAALRVLVRDGRVDYKAAASSRPLKRFLDKVGAVDALAISRWSREEKLAFYINVYNALAIQTVVEAMPTDSIRTIQPDAFDTSRWLVAGRKLSLDTIEHKKLRGDLKEPRVHFVLVCAARSCPELSTRAYRADSLDQQLDAAAREFVRDRSKNHVFVEQGRVELSSIFLWFGDDFVGWEGLQEMSFKQELSVRDAAILRTIARYLSREEREFLQEGSFRVAFTEYDWALNAR